MNEDIWLRIRPERINFYHAESGDLIPGHAGETSAA
jgi:hypothetical protein